MKFLIKLASFVICVGILGFGGYQTVQEMKIDEMIGEIETALENTPTLPEFGGNGGSGDTEQGGNGGSGDIEQGGNGGSGDTEQGGNTGSGDTEQGGNGGSGDIEQGGNAGSGDIEQGGNTGSGDTEQGGNAGSGDTEQGGNAGSGDTEQGGNTDSGDGETNTTLSTNDAVDALGSMYDSSDPEFNDMNREFFVGMVEGFISGGSSNDSGSEDDTPAEDPDFDNNFDADFGDDFNPDEFVPEEEPETPEDEEQDEVNDIILDVAGTYYENLQAGIQQNIEANAGATEEEQQAARDEFVQQEAEAFAGLINIATRPEETTDDQLVQSVDAVINSSVCLDTVTQSVNNNEDLSTTVQDATANMNEETKAEIENKLNEALASNPEKEQQYSDLANLFGITLGSSTEIPDGVNPEDIPGYNG